MKKYSIAKINKNSFPQAFLDNYFLADGIALKIAIYFLVHGEADVEQLSEELQLKDNQVQRGVQFWLDRGLLTDRDTMLVADEHPAVQTIKEKHDQNWMAQRVLANPEVAALLQESQRVLGREISINESRMLIEMMDDYPYSASDILLVESFWVNRKPSSKVLTETLRTLREMHKLNYLTHSEVERHVQIMEKRDEYYLQVASALKISVDDINRKERKLINECYEQMGYDLSFVQEALLRKEDATIPYIHAVLKDWHKKGYQTISQTRINPVNIASDAPNQAKGQSSWVEEAIASYKKRSER